MNSLWFGYKKKYLENAACLEMLLGHASHWSKVSSLYQVWEHMKQEKMVYEVSNDKLAWWFNGFAPFFVYCSNKPGFYYKLQNYNFIAAS